MEAWPFSKKFGTTRAGCFFSVGEEGTRESELVNWRGGHRRHGVKEGNVKRNLQWEESQLYERGGLVTIKGFKIRASKEKGVDKLTTPCFSLSSGGWGWHNEIQV